MQGLELDVNRVDGRVLGGDWFEDVASARDNDLRAHRIALAYTHLAAILDEAIHGDVPAISETGARRPVVNANWFHFALWGTLTVSQNIGNDRSPQRLNSGLAAPLRRRLTPSVLRIKASDGQRVGRALAWGQRRIFLNVCTAMANFFEVQDDGGIVPKAEFTSAPDRQTEEVRTLIATDDPGVKKQRHERPLAQAFQWYALARRLGHSAEEEEHRAKLVFGANVLMTAVEQDIVDREISVVVDLVPNMLADSVSWRLARIAERARGVPAHLSYLMMSNMRPGERRAIDTFWSRLMTDQVLVMALPTETLRLGRDIPPRDRGAPYLPAHLRSLSPRQAPADEAVRKALAQIADHVRSFDRTAGDGRGSAARDWRRWDERMNWATTLLRSRQQDDTLYWRPYSQRDEERIIVGDLPMRSGDPSALDVGAPLDDRDLDGFISKVSREERRKF